MLGTCWVGSWSSYMGTCFVDGLAWLWAHIACWYMYWIHMARMAILHVAHEQCMLKARSGLLIRMLSECMLLNPQWMHHSLNTALWKDITTFFLLVHGTSSGSLCTHVCGGWTMTPILLAKTSLSPKAWGVRSFEPTCTCTYMHVFWNW